MFMAKITETLKNIHVHNKNSFQLWKSNPTSPTQKKRPLLTTPILKKGSIYKSLVL